MENTINIILTVLTLAAVIVAIVAVVINGKNNRKQIRTNKLEEIFEIIQTISLKFGGLYILYNELKAINIEDEQMAKKYFLRMNNFFSENERSLLLNSFPRFDLLVSCYTKKDLQKELTNFSELFYSLVDVVFKGESFYFKAVWKKEIPKPLEFSELKNRLQKNIVKEMSL